MTIRMEIHGCMTSYAKKAKRKKIESQILPNPKILRHHVLVKSFLWNHDVKSLWNFMLLQTLRQLKRIGKKNKNIANTKVRALQRILHHRLDSSDKLLSTRFSQFHNEIFWIFNPNYHLRAFLKRVLRKKLH